MLLSDYRYVTNAVDFGRMGFIPYGNTGTVPRIMKDDGHLAARKTRKVRMDDEAFLYEALAERFDILGICDSITFSPTLPPANVPFLACRGRVTSPPPLYNPFYNSFSSLPPRYSSANFDTFFGNSVSYGVMPAGGIAALLDSALGGRKGQPPPRKVSHHGPGWDSARRLSNLFYDADTFWIGYGIADGTTRHPTVGTSMTGTKKECPPNTGFVRAMTRCVGGQSWQTNEPRGGPFYGGFNPLAFSREPSAEAAARIPWDNAVLYVGVVVKIPSSLEWRRGSDGTEGLVSADLYAAFRLQRSGNSFLNSITFNSVLYTNCLAALGPGGQLPDIGDPDKYPSSGYLFTSYIDYIYFVVKTSPPARVDYRFPIADYVPDV